MCRCSCPALCSYRWLRSHMDGGECRSLGLGHREGLPSLLDSCTAMAADTYHVYRLGTFYTRRKMSPANPLYTHTLQVWNSFHSPHCSPPNRLVHHSISPSSRACRTAVLHGCTCSGQNDRSWECIFENSFLHSNVPRR